MTAKTENFAFREEFFFLKKKGIASIVNEISLMYINSFTQRGT